MPARRCSVCSVNYSAQVQTCPECGASTWYLANEDPDPVTVEEAQQVNHSDPEGWRRMQYERMGFTVGQAYRLAGTRDAVSGFFLYWADVEEQLNRARVRLGAFAVDVVFDMYA